MKVPTTKKAVNAANNNAGIITDQKIIFINGDQLAIWSFNSENFGNKDLLLTKEYK